MSRSRFRWLVVGVVGALTSVTAFAAGSGAATAPTPGVSDQAVKIGFVYSGTGVAAATSGDSDAGCKARVGRANAEGGVGGRKVDVVYKDDQSAQNLSVVQNLVENENVFMVINDSAFAFLTYRWLLDHGVPLIGGGFDGNYYGAPGNEKVISPFGNGPPVSGIQTTVNTNIMKALGATKVAAIGYGVSPASTANVKSFSEFAVPAVGLESVYTNTSVDFGATDVGPVVLGIKNAGADAAYYAMNANTNIAIAQGLIQNNSPMKAEIMATGYGQNLLDQPIAKSLPSDIVFTSGWAPVELGTKATKRFQSDLKKYAGYEGVPDFGVYSGYITCDLAILGLEQQGKAPAQATFAEDLRALGKVNPGGGLGCSDIGLSAETYGKVAASGGNQRVCAYAVQVKDGKFVLLKPKGSKAPYWTGKLIDESVPPEYRSASSSSATTTTATK